METPAVTTIARKYFLDGPYYVNIALSPQTLGWHIGVRHRESNCQYNMTFINQPDSLDLLEDQMQTVSRRLHTRMLKDWHGCTVFPYPNYSPDVKALFELTGCVLRGIYAPVLGHITALVKPGKWSAPLGNRWAITQHWPMEAWADLIKSRMGP